MKTAKNASAKTAKNVSSAKTYTAIDPKARQGKAYPIAPMDILPALRRPDGRVNMARVKEILVKAGKWEKGFNLKPLVEKYNLALSFAKKSVVAKAKA